MKQSQYSIPSRLCAAHPERLKLTMTMLTIVLLATLLACVHPWTFETPHTNIIPDVTNDVNLKCLYDGKSNGKTNLTHIIRVRIQKMDQEGNWTELASKGILGEAIQVDNASVSGCVDHANNSFLSITWPLASKDTVGNYRCEVDGFDKSLSIVVVKDIFANITSAPVTVDDLLHVILSMEKKSKKAHHLYDIVKQNQNALGIDMTNLQKIHSDDNETLSIKISSLKYGFTGNESIIKPKPKPSIGRQWPEGEYALMEPETGCPQFDTWLNGSIQIMIFETPLVPEASPEKSNHLAKPLIDKTTLAFNMRFCMNKQTTGRLNWPPGSYCIQSGPNTCPPSFNKTTMTFTHKIRTIVSKSINTPFFTTSGKEMTLTYCCRKDAPYSTPITLPTATPFYLFRYGGTCQVVRGMKESNESLAITTTSINDNGSATFSPPDVYPDGKRWNYERELCYYSLNKLN